MTTKDEALAMALEALEALEIAEKHMAYVEFTETITAIREAQAQPPKWQVLSDSERLQIVQNHRLNVGDWTQNGRSVAEAIEAKLREKNARKPSNASEAHSCPYHCDRPECVRAQRDELRERLAGVEAGGEPESFEQWNEKQHGDPEEIGFLQALRIAYCSGQDSVYRTRPQPKAIHAGYALVPVEPTPEMVEAIGVPGSGMYEREVWAAMLSAAPKPEKEPG